MKEEINRLLLSLQRLLDSSADHDILYDIFVSPANPDGYREALDEIRQAIGMIRDSGASREDLLRAFSEPGCPRVPALEGIVTLRDLVPLLGTGFSPEQDDQIRNSCHCWAEALDPCIAGDIEGILSSAVRSLDLADLLAPEVTRMLRFPAILSIQEAADRGASRDRNKAPEYTPKVNDETGGSGNAALDQTIPFFPAIHAVADRIIAVPCDDTAQFAGSLYQGIFTFLVQRGLIPKPLFPDTLSQSLFDLGVLHNGSPDHGYPHFPGAGLPEEEGGHSGPYRDEPWVVRLLEEGTLLAGAPGALDDIRTLYRIALRASPMDGDPGLTQGCRSGTGRYKDAGRTGNSAENRTRGDHGEFPGTAAGRLPEMTLREHRAMGSISSAAIGSAAGHVLAGWAIAGAAQRYPETFREREESEGESLPDPTTPSEPDPGVNAIGQILSFVRSVACRPTGRSPPGQERIRALDQTVREMEQLLRAVTGDYSWKAVAYPHPAEGFRPAVDLWPDRHILLFDREDLGFRGGDSSRALLMEAYYRYRSGTGADGSEPWFERLALVLGIPRAVKAGLLLHPGAGRWMEALAMEEGDPANGMAGRVFIGRLPLPDQFLAGALQESRTGGRADIVPDAKVLEALDSTRVSRLAAENSALTGEELSSILREEIWPVFERLLHEPAGYEGPGAGELSGERPAAPGIRGISSEKSRGGPTLTARGTAPRVDTSVPHSTFPTADTPGRIIEGAGGGLLDDDGFQVGGIGTGRSAGSGESGPDKAPAARGRGGVPGGPMPGEEGGSQAPWSPDRQSSPGGGNAQSGNRPSSGRDAGAPETPGPGPGIRETVEDLVQACSRGLDMLRDQTSRESPEPGDEHLGMDRWDSMQAEETGRGTDQEDARAGPGESAYRQPGSGSGITHGGEKGSDQASLRDLAREIDDLINSLGEQLRELRDAHPGEEETGLSGPAMGRPPGKGQEMDDLLKTSENVFRAAGEFRKAVNDLEREIRESGSGTGASRIRTGMTRKTLMDLQEAGVEFQRMTGASFRSGPGESRPFVRVPDQPEEPAPAQPPRSARTGPVAPAFMADAVDSAEVWESLSYFDASYGDDEEQGEDGTSTGLYTRGTAEQRYVQGEQALTHEAARYLSALQHRTRSEWESIEEKAERIRQIALFETNEVGEDDFAMYQRFYQPVAGLVGVARKNIQQALQKNRATRDLTELSSGDDIDEENLAAVRTTMRIFRDSGKQEDRATWCLSLLLDASSSMHDETVAKKLEATIRTAILFGEALNRVQGITFEIAAFADTEYIPLKRYQDDWNIHQGCYLIRQLHPGHGRHERCGSGGQCP